MSDIPERCTARTAEPVRELAEHQIASAPFPAPSAVAVTTAAGRTSALPRSPATTPPAAPAVRLTGLAAGFHAVAHLCRRAPTSRP
jgi:hypothetical protein